MSFQDDHNKAQLPKIIQDYVGLPAFVVAVVFLGLGLWWITLQPTYLEDYKKEFVPRRPVVYETPPPRAGAGISANLGALIPGTGTASSLPGSWPLFRGPLLDNIAKSPVELARSWPESGPPVLWTVEMGEGHAGAAIHNGRVYVIDYDRDKQEDAIRCLSLDSGEEIWRYTYSVEIKRNHGMSRTVPVVNDKYVVALGPKLHLHCLDAVTGEKKWFIDLVKDYDCVIPQWYAGQCPLIEGDTVIIAPGTKPLIMRVNLETGEVVWRSQPDLDDMGMTHSSVLPIEFEGIRQYVYCTQEGAVGVAADDGRRLWTLPDWKIGIANIPTPVWLGDGRLFFSGGYEKGSMMAQLEKTADGGIGAKELWSLPARDFGSDQQTPIYYNGHIYGVKPRPAELLCLDPKDGARLWTSGGARRFGLGPYVIVDDLLFVLDDRSCNLHMLEANPKEYKELGRAQMMDGHDAWAPMAFANGLLILRDLTIMKCVDLRK